MKTLLVGINSSYIHTNPAVEYLKAACNDDCGEVFIFETTINDSFNSILSSIYKIKPNCVAFSCYIWNIEHVLKLAHMLKLILPDAHIVLGGPEVSYESKVLFMDNIYIDFIIRGEGEVSFPQLLKAIICGESDYSQIDGLVWRSDSNINENECTLTGIDINSIPSIYIDKYKIPTNRILYYESSRGCPYSCTYCLSSSTKGVREIPIQRVLSELSYLIKHGAKTVKFVDRTFNYNEQRAITIIKHIIDETNKYSRTDDATFHFEISPKISSKLLEIIKAAPEGLLQFEAGIQSTCKKVLKAVNRNIDADLNNFLLESLIKIGNSSVYVDLIAGLPYESIETFEETFDTAYNLKAHRLQLGFLKILKGSVLKKQAKKYGYIYSPYPPYEIVSNEWMSYDELLIIKGIEELTERYLNTGRFNLSLDYMCAVFDNKPYMFYKNFSEYLIKNEINITAKSESYLYKVFAEFSYSVDKAVNNVVDNLLRFDYYSTHKSKQFTAISEQQFLSDGFKERCFEYIKNDFIEMPNESSKNIYKNVHFARFDFDIMNYPYSFKNKETIYLFNYYNKSRVSGLFSYTNISKEFCQS